MSRLVGPCASCGVVTETVTGQALVSRPVLLVMWAKRTSPVSSESVVKGTCADVPMRLGLSDGSLVWGDVDRCVSRYELVAMCSSRSAGFGSYVSLCRDRGGLWYWFADEESGTVCDGRSDGAPFLFVYELCGGLNDVGSTVLSELCICTGL